ncbi:MAG: SGNH/GDSL hydrolase family protein [Pseudomonadota bacterium]
MRWILAVSLAVLAACAQAQEARVLVIGDSIMAWNEDQSIPAAMAEALGAPVRDESVSGARLSHPARLLVGPMDIRSQAPRAPFDWIVMTGGGNDLAVECSCAVCDEVLDGMVTADGMLGAFPDFLDEVSARGTRVLYVGYYENPVGGGPFSGCERVIDTLEARIEDLARRREDLFAIDASDVFDSSDLSLYDADRLHPSPKGSALLGRWIADALKDFGG